MADRRILALALLLLPAGGCAVQQISGGGPVLTRINKVPARDVAVYTNVTDVRGPYTVIEDVWVKDDHDTLPAVLERDLREVAGARGANAVILAATNRQLNGTRADWQVRLDNPFEYYAGTAIWVGGSPPPAVVLQP